MTLPHALDYNGKLYPPATHLWHAMRFLRPTERRGRESAEESWYLEIAERVRQSTCPALYADHQARYATVVGADGEAKSLQRPDWEEVQMGKMDEVLMLKFTQHPELGQMLISTHAAELLSVGDPPWGAGPDLKGPNQLGKAIMRCRELLFQYGE
ncbi:hypothetical protein FRC12_006838 [Ceratobasidium sp. 428]|nr:hypothetical protein FRC12_006838 [Ceratobasidium sp. 428]